MDYLTLGSSVASKQAMPLNSPIRKSSIKMQPNSKQPKQTMKEKKTTRFKDGGSNEVVFQEKMSQWSSAEKRSALGRSPQPHDNSVRFQEQDEYHNDRNTVK